MENRKNKETAKKPAQKSDDSKLPSWFNMNPETAVTTEEDTKEMEEILTSLV